MKKPKIYILNCNMYLGQKRNPIPRFKFYSNSFLIDRNKVMNEWMNEWMNSTTKYLCVNSNFAKALDMHKFWAHKYFSFHRPLKKLCNFKKKIDIYLKVSLPPPCPYAQMS